MPFVPSLISAPLVSVSARKDGFDPDNVQLPHQCLSVDFAFAGPLSKDETHRQDIEGINSETCWLMIRDRFSKMVHSKVRISKAPPFQFINNFLTTCAPAEATQKCVMLD